MIGFRNNLYLYSSSAYSCNEHCFCLRYSMTPNLACSVTLFLFCYLGHHPFYCFIVQVHACTILLVSFVKKIVIGWQECLPRIVMGIMIDKERATGSTAPERAESSVISVQDRETCHLFSLFLPFSTGMRTLYLRSCILENVTFDDLSTVPTTYYQPCIIFCLSYPK
jgi:hypothetical protein